MWTNELLEKNLVGVENLFKDYRNIELSTQDRIFLEGLVNDDYIWEYVTREGKLYLIYLGLTSNGEDIKLFIN